ncbi:MAG: glycosyltransferase family 4 protein [Saprospiraceae bacterium]|nr:glycosyltransferase family 4 protein [Saprospiraceae bacterium]
MKNILVCAVDYDIGSSGAYHFSHYILEINDILNAPYRIWLLTDDLDENVGQRNKKTMAYIQKVPFDYPSWLFPFYHFLRNWAYYKAIRRFQKENTVDAVVFSQAFYGVLSRLLLPKGIKTAGIVHDAMSLTPQRNSHFSWKSYVFFSLTQRPLEILANRWHDFTVANSRFIQSLILEKRQLPNNRVPMIYQSMDVAKIPFYPRPWFYTEGDVIKILFVKSGFIGGGLQDLIEALGQLPYSFQLTIVGPPPYVHSIIEDWAAPFSHIILRFCGRLTHSEVLELMSNHHILSIPSRQEALGLANIEGLAQGISVVSTRVGGIPEVLGQGEFGWLAEATNTKSLATALKDCIETDPSVRFSKSQKGRIHVEQLFTKEKMLADFLALFEKMTA